MSVAKDILLDENGELLFRNGDFVVGPSDKQNIQSILNAFPGWWKQFPEVGVGMMKYLNSTGREQEMQRNIKLQLESDGFTVDSVIIKSTTKGQFTIETNAHRV
jgi:hypothetical protein